MAGLYIHIPFCESRCIYCGFYSTTLLPLRQAYAEALCREMSLRPLSSVAGEGERIETVYLGGGTPSMLSTAQLRLVFERIQAVYGPFMADGNTMEITMECNPDDVTDDFCTLLKTLPVNRVSMGAQTFSDERLRFLRRRHRASDVRQAVSRLREAGIHNISIDLMFGFPGETLQDWQQDLEEALRLRPEHISAYSLMIEEETPLWRMVCDGNIQETDEETSRRMYDTLIDTLSRAGYEHYEISNFALPGRQSRHNSSYWHERPYLGLGAAAHSYARKQCVERSWNVADVRQYMQSIESGRLPSTREILDKPTQYNDLVATALRTCRGISLAQLKASYGETFSDYLLREARPHLCRGLMEQTPDGHLRLTRQGLYVSDDVMSDLVWV